MFPHRPNSNPDANANANASDSGWCACNARSVGRAAVIGCGAIAGGVLGFAFGLPASSNTGQPAYALMTTCGGFFLGGAAAANWFDGPDPQNSTPGMNAASRTAAIGDAPGETQVLLPRAAPSNS